MKKLILMLAVAAATFTSCEKKSNAPEVNPNVGVGETKTLTIVATDALVWHYISLTEGKVVATAGSLSPEETALAAKNNWDIAISSKPGRVRTNGGTSTTVGSKGGVYVHSETIKFNDITSILNNTTFEVDIIRETKAMGAPTTPFMESQSNAKTVIMGAGMPPVFSKAPVYTFCTSNGDRYYKVEFTKYKNADGVSGHVTMQFAEIAK